MKHLLCLFTLLGILGLSVPGCGGKGKQKDRVKVSGLVTMDGRVLKQATVQFVSADGESTGSGLTDDEGRYQLMVSPGDYKVTISQVVGASESDPSDPHSFMKKFEMGAPGAGSTSGPKQLVPPKYSDPARTTLKVDVPEGGRNDADFTNLVSK